MKRKRVLRIISVCLIIAMGGILMFGLSGCGSTKYKLDYGGRKDAYVGAKDAYRSGAKVKIYYPYIATDTDYSFYIDGERLNVNYNEKKGFILTFTMPAHNVKLECRSVNSMVYTPPEEEHMMLVDYYTGVTGTDGYDRHDELVLNAYTPEYAKLEVYRQEAGKEEELCGTYIVPYEAVDRCYDVIKKHKMEKWHKMRHAAPPTGGTTALRFKKQDSDEYVRVSIEEMPEGGEQMMDEVGIVMREYIKDEYKQ